MSSSNSDEFLKGIMAFITLVAIGIAITIALMFGVGVGLILYGIVCIVYYDNFLPDERWFPIMFGIVLVIIGFLTAREAINTANGPLGRWARDTIFNFVRLG